MQKKIFSKRKSKIFGLCGTILTMAAIALATAGPVQAEDSQAQVAPQITQTAESQTPAAAVSTQADSSSAADQAATTSTPEQVTDAAPVSQEAAPLKADTAELPQTNTAEETNSTSDALQTPQTSTSDVKTADAAAAPAQNQTEQPAKNTANAPENNANKPAANASKPATTADKATAKVYDSVNFNDDLTSIAKIAKVADIVYNGTRDEYITIDDPSQPYQPNTTEIAKYLNQYLTELRQINGIDFPVPPVDQIMQDFAQARANEEAAESDGLEHDTKLPFPQGITWYVENGHMDNNLRRTNAKGQTIASDKATAYYLALNWFADYFNIMGDPNDGLTSFGHAISMLSSSGSGMGLGIADGQGGESKSWYAELVFGGNGNNSDEQGFTSQKDANGNWVLYYNGNPVKFLPNTTFHYLTSSNSDANPQDPGAKPGADDNKAADPLPDTPQNQPNAPQNPEARWLDPSDSQAAKPNENALDPVLAEKAPQTAKVISKTTASLPETGSKTSLLMTVLGIGLTLIGVGLIAFKNRNKN
ncbi:LPXTG cell wall anchor domain-containing protein [Streptococcus orisasini]|uniref:LPXTG cell wall anchor domain-containing protein n=1 Tax=Streptococcus orisasini TaxID=1080071 RepID=UPI00070E86FB|nr:LPXTG cell wall anchor domain-containing protein [Streptococcus orisasini]